MLEDPSKLDLLCVYDLCTQPLSIGDIIVFIEGALIVAETMGLENIDFCFSFDQSVIHAEPAFHSMLKNGDHLYHALRLSTLLQFNRKIKTISIIDSYAKLHKFIRSRENYDLMWPSLEQINNRSYCYYEAHHMMLDYWRKHNKLPQLSPPTKLLEWCQKFFLKYCNGKAPVSVNLRNNPAFAINRNCQIDQWIDFFRACEETYPVSFIVICDMSEIDPRLESLSNVVVSKTKGSNLEEDMALIMQSTFHMGSSSGPTAIATIKTSPYYIANTDCSPHLALYQGAFTLCSDGKIRTAWATQHQAFSAEKESKEELLKAFISMWESIQSDNS